MVLPKYQGSEAVKEDNNITQRIQAATCVVSVKRMARRQLYSKERKKKGTLSKTTCKAVTLSCSVSSKTDWQTLKYIRKKSESCPHT